VSTGPEIADLRTLMQAWTTEELGAFFCCVRTDERQGPPNDRSRLVDVSIEELFWAYNSKMVAETKRKTAQLKLAAYELFPNGIKNRVPRPSPIRAVHEYSTSLSYEFLLREEVPRNLSTIP
jgi:hypothetical protein